MYCNACKREVGTKKKIVAPLVTLFLSGVVLVIPVLGAIAYFFIFIACILWLMCAGRVCAICGSTALSDGSINVTDIVDSRRTEQSEQ